MAGERFQTNQTEEKELTLLSRRVQIVQNKVMTSKKTTTDGTQTTRAKRTPRTLTDMEKEAKQHYEDIKNVAKMLPAVAELSATGRMKLREELARLDNAETGSEFKA